MKKILKFLLIIFIFAANGFVVLECFCAKSFKNNILNVKSEILYDKNYSYDFKNNKHFLNIVFKVNDESYNINDFRNKNISKNQVKIINSGVENRIKIVEFALKNGFNKYQAVTYAFPEIVEFINFVKNKYCFSPKDAELKTHKNTGDVYIQKETVGLDFDVNKFIDEFFKNLLLFKNEFYVNLRFFKLNTKNDCDFFKDKLHLRGAFKTIFKYSSDSRKNNIKKAMNSLDGVVIDSGEIFSFNKCTGKRDKDSGYMKAKTIKNGSFYEEFGGGVCQVSTTLYNAAVLSDLEILEVNPHSLPVSYIEPCFDAMVSEGVSDLKIKNNTRAPIIIACSSVNDECLINIYGVENGYNIKRVSKKLNEIENFKHEEVFDYKSFGLDEPLNKGERLTISTGKNGYEAEGCLEYYKNNILVKTKKIRKNIYYPTKDVVLVG